jgi:hypothetical protein
MPGGKLRASIRGLKLVEQAKADIEFGHSQNIRLSLSGFHHSHPGQRAPKQVTNQDMEIRLLFLADILLLGFQALFTTARPLIRNTYPD